MNALNIVIFSFVLTGLPQVQMEIGLPNEQGRVQILSIHTSRMRDYKKINPDVDIKVRQIISCYILSFG